MSTRPLRHKQHVPRGERQAILARRNQQFEASISRNMATATEDTISDAGEGDDWTQPHITAKINNNGNYYHCFQVGRAVGHFWLIDLDD
jgi:hypothetical protein